MSQTWMIISGKGGAGKSMITSALGIALANREMSCCCVDMDIGLRTLDMLENEGTAYRRQAETYQTYHMGRPSLLSACMCILAQLFCCNGRFFCC